MITVEKILLEYDPKANNLLPVLKRINAGFGYVSKENAQKVAEYFSLPLSKVFETASFYDLISTQKQPLLVVKVCSGSDCAMSGSSEVICELENLLGVKTGDDFNPKFKLEKISCLGRCSEGPVVVVGGDVFEKVTPSSVHEILEGKI